jgi:hypothetical protein
MLFGDKKIVLDNEQQGLDAIRRLETLSPLVHQIYSNQALFMIGKGFNTIFELFFYILGLAVIAFSFIMDTVFPFHVMRDLLSGSIIESSLTTQPDLVNFGIAIRGLVVLIGLLFILFGIMLRKSGKQKSLLQAAGKELKSLEAHFIQLKQALPATTTSGTDSNANVTTTTL